MKKGDGAPSKGELGPGAAVSVDAKTGAASEPTAAEFAAAAPLALLPSAGAEAGSEIPLDSSSKLAVKKLHARIDEERGGRTFAYLWIQNLAAARGPLPVEVVFAFPPPEGSAAPFLPVFAHTEVPSLRENGAWIAEVEAAPAPGGEPKYLRILAPSGAAVPAAAASEASTARLRRGTLLFGGRVEVVLTNADLLGPKPSLSFTLKNVAPPVEPPASGEKDPDDPMGELRYRVRFYRDGAPLDLGEALESFRPVGAALAGRGSTVTFRVEGLESATGLAGAWPVLTLERREP